MSDQTPPDYFTPEHRAVWTDLRAEALALGVIAQLNPDKLNSLVVHIIALRQAQALLAQSGAMVIRDGKAAANPTNKVLEAEERTITRIRKELRLGRPRQDAANPKMLGKWCDQHGRVECTGHRQTDGGECHAVAVLGMDKCKRHAGVNTDESPAHIAAIVQRDNPLAGEPMDISPAQALLWRVRVLSGEVHRLDERIAQLEQEELVYGVTAETEEHGDDTVTSKVTRGPRINAWLILRSERERMLNVACEAALRAGVEQALVEIAREHVATLRTVILVALERIGGIHADDPRIREQLPSIIRELTA